MIQAGNLEEISLHLNSFIETESTIIYRIKYVRGKLESISVIFIINISLKHVRKIIKQIKHTKNILSTSDFFEHILARIYNKRKCLSWK